MDIENMIQYLGTLSGKSSSAILRLAECSMSTGHSEILLIQVDIFWLDLSNYSRNVLEARINETRQKNMGLQEPSMNTKIRSRYEKVKVSNF